MRITDIWRQRIQARSLCLLGLARRIHLELRLPPVATGHRGKIFSVASREPDACSAPNESCEGLSVERLDHAGILSKRSVWRRSGLFHVSARLQPALEAAEIAHVGITHFLEGLADER